MRLGSNFVLLCKLPAIQGYPCLAPFLPPHSPGLSFESEQYIYLALFCCLATIFCLVSGLLWLLPCGGEEHEIKFSDFVCQAREALWLKRQLLGPDLERGRGGTLIHPFTRPKTFSKEIAPNPSHVIVLGVHQECCPITLKGDLLFRILYMMFTVQSPGCVALKEFGQAQEPKR